MRVIVVGISSASRWRRGDKLFLPHDIGGAVVLTWTSARGSNRGRPDAERRVVHRGPHSPIRQIGTLRVIYIVFSTEAASSE